VLEPGQNRPATLISQTIEVSPNVFVGTVIVDWNDDYNVEVCYQDLVNVNNKRIERQSINLEKCLPFYFYYEFLKKFERYKPEQPSQTKKA
jgi:hypothetical protein